MRRGWQNESWRHSLAARGIKTNQKNNYMKMKLLEEKKTEEEELFKLRQLESVRQESFDELEDAINDGKLSSEDAALFWRDDFPIEKDLFVRGGQTHDQFKENTARKRKSHIARFGKSMSMNEMLEKK